MVTQLGINHLKPVSKTLFLPLYARAVESVQLAPLVIDHKVLEIVQRTDFDYTGFTALFGYPLYQVCLAMRTREFDNQTQAFLLNHPDGLIVNIGCGLDTRYYRVDNGSLEWYDLDFPEVIALRREFLPDEPRCHSLAGSVLDFEWISQVKAKGKRPCLFIAEGVLMYLAKEEVKRLALTLRQEFSGAEMIFDAISAWPTWFSFQNELVNLTGATFRWRLLSSQDLERWAEGIELMEEWYYFDQAEPRLGWYNLWHFYPLFNQAFRILHYRLGQAPPPAPAFPQTLEAE